MTRRAGLPTGLGERPVNVSVSRCVDVRQGVRAFDPRRDCRAVAELITLSFAGHLDPVGQAALAEMRRTARRRAWLQWLLQPPWPQKGIVPGFVWVEDGGVVGNVSLRQALGAMGYFVGNVSVHPAWRGRGIAGALMRAALDEIATRGESWIGLEVRTDNLVARRLYEHLGFREVGTTVCMLRAAGLPSRGAAPPSPYPMRRGRSQDASALLGLARAPLPALQRPLLELRGEDYRPGWERTLAVWLTGKREAWWVADDRGEVRGAVRAVRERGQQPDRLELLVGLDYVGQLEIALAHWGVARLRGGRRMIQAILPGPAGQLTAALADAGFERSHELAQMRLDFTQRRVAVRSYL